MNPIEKYIQLIDYLAENVIPENPTYRTLLSLGMSTATTIFNIYLILTVPIYGAIFLPVTLFQFYTLGAVRTTTTED